MIELGKRRQVLFLTGCVNPNGMAFTLLQDPLVRRVQYIETLRFYLNNTHLPIVFVENSGVDLKIEFKEEVEKKRMEILTFNGNNYRKFLGKGYGEMIIIEHALSHSDFLKNSDFIFKITGRYKILNIAKILKADYNNVDIVADLRNYLSFCDSRFFGSTYSFVSEFLVKNKNSINDSVNIFFEHILSRAIHEAMSKGYRFSILKHKPRFSGIYGTDNSRINSSYFAWYYKDLLYKLRYLLYR